MVYEYMIPVYAYLVKAGSREIEGVPEHYRLSVAEFMASQIEKE
jgi:hypothetical protein